MPQLSFADSIRRAILDAPVSRYRLSKNLKDRKVDVTETTLSGFVRGRHWIGEKLLNAIARELGLRVVGKKRSVRRKSR